MINQELQHQIEIMRAQKHIELSGPVEEVLNYIQALSRIYDLTNNIADQTKRFEDIKKLALSCTNDYDLNSVKTTMGIIASICDGNYKVD